MKLTDFIKEIDSFDDELIIFQHDENDFNSDIILAFGEENDGGVKKIDGVEYKYLIEVFLAKEFIIDWQESIDYIPTKLDMAKRLFEYAQNDA
jgi:hypothetical protein